MSFIRATTVQRLSAARSLPWRRKGCQRWIASSRRERKTFVGITTPHPEESVVDNNCPFHLDTGYAVLAKRPSRAFPPPFFSPPSGSFSDPLSTHDKSVDRRAQYHGQPIRGVTNGDDAVLVEGNLICANDGVGAWATRDKGHAALWSRLVLHFFALEMGSAIRGESKPDPVVCLQKAFESTKKATSEPNQWQGTTTTTSAFLYHTDTSPLLYVTNLGDSRVMVIRPSSAEVIYKTSEQWHWFDCPFQLGTNSVDSPKENAVCDKVPLEVDDVVVAMTDGLCDNLWDHEIVDIVVKSLKALTEESEARTAGKRVLESGGAMSWVAEELVREARVIAEDPFAESPYMERAVEDGISYEGGMFHIEIYTYTTNLIPGKLDDISVIAAVCKRRSG